MYDSIGHAWILLQPLVAAEKHSIFTAKITNLYCFHVLNILSFPCTFLAWYTGFCKDRHTHVYIFWSPCPSKKYLRFLGQLQERYFWVLSTARLQVCKGYSPPGLCDWRSYKLQCSRLGTLQSFVTRLQPLRERLRFLFTSLSKALQGGLAYTVTPCLTWSAGKGLWCAVPCALLTALKASFVPYPNSPVYYLRTHKYLFFYFTIIPTTILDFIAAACIRDVTFNLSPDKGVQNSGHGPSLSSFYPIAPWEGAARTRPCPGFTYFFNWSSIQAQETHWLLPNAKTIFRRAWCLIIYYHTCLVTS